MTSSTEAHLQNIEKRQQAVTDRNSSMIRASDSHILAPIDDIKHMYVGKSPQDVPAPAPIIDVSIVRRNCKLMLDSIEALGLGFRAHVKTHKTLEVTKMQIGEGCTNIKLVVSTVAELEFLLPWLNERRSNGAQVNVLYGIPVGPSSIPRLAEAARQLGPNSVGLFIDHADHIRMLDTLSADLWPNSTASVFIKIDIGGHRAGVMRQTQQMLNLCGALVKAHRVKLVGFYGYNDQSYSVSSPAEALQYLINEIVGLKSAADDFLTLMSQATGASMNTNDLTLSLGNSPTVTAIQNFSGASGGLALKAGEALRAKELLRQAGEAYHVEMHAGVYTVLDLQQLSTQARPASLPDEPAKALLTTNELGLQIMAEIVSVYEDREQPEALIAAGSIVLGREPCKSYSGWGVLSRVSSPDGQFIRPGITYHPVEQQTGWIVRRISQEHGVLAWQGDRKQYWPLRLGDRVLLWPNHACMAGPSFPFYLVVDSDKDGDAYRIQDIWRRCRGW